MNKDCKNVNNFIYEIRRLCSTYHNCDKCMEDNKLCISDSICDINHQNIDAETIISTIQEWSNNNPEIYLTTREKTFLRCLNINGFIFIARNNSRLYLQDGNDRIEIDNDMFLFIQEGNSMSIENILKLDRG